MLDSADKYMAANGFEKLIELISSFDKATSPERRIDLREGIIDELMRIFPDTKHENHLWPIVEILSEPSL